MPHVFRLEPSSTRLQLSPNDVVTSVAATGGLLWVGTQSGRLLRHRTHNDQTDEVRGRLGVGRLDNPVERIYADLHSHAALVLLKNAYGYYAQPSGPLRPRWLAKLRGLRCVSAAWVRVQDTSIALLGTAYGALFSLAIDYKYERDDTLAKLWSAPNGDRIDGIRVEKVASKYVGTIATTSALYLFSDADTLVDLFTEQRMTTLTRPDTPPSASSEQLVLPSELQFMTGSSGLASRRFVWAGSQGVTHAQLAVRRRPIQRVALADTETSHMSRSTVMASIVDTETISWTTLKGVSGSSVPLACNLSSFHVLVLYPGAMYAFNHISGRLTQKVLLWSPEFDANTKGATSDRPFTSPLTTSRPASSTGVARHSGDEGVPNKYLSSPAAGFARDVLLDALWIYTADGEFTRLVASNEEYTEAWKAAKAMGKFELAMALAPHVSSGMADDSATLQTQEAVREAQADHEVEQGHWDIAAQLLARTKRPIESVVLNIAKANSATSRAKAPSKGEFNLDNLGIARRREMTKHTITYLVRRLDRMDMSRPAQRTILATMLVQLYSLQLSSETNEKNREAVRQDFSHFLADRHKDLDVGTALDVLHRSGCHDEAWKLAVLSGDVVLASKLLSRRGQVDLALTLLKNHTVVSDNDTFSRLIVSMSNFLIPLAPQKVTAAISRALKKDSHNIDHITVVQALARVAREAKDMDMSREAYLAAVAFLYELLHDWKDVVSKRPEYASDETGTQGWSSLVILLFQLHAEFGKETEAQRSFDHLVAPRLSKDVSAGVTNTLGAILRSAQNAGFRRLSVYLYQALGLHEAAIKQAVDIDIELAETKVAQLSATKLPEKLIKSLWCLVASKSDDPVGIVEHSKGLLHIEDVLTSMAPFESATERVKMSVADSLDEHKRLANVAKSEAMSALEVIQSLREDLTIAQQWHQSKQAKRHRQRHRTFSCGHKTKTSAKTGTGAAEECALCGRQAIDSIDKAFDSGLSLPIHEKK
ncbi:unnamed protein product [Agarophyton chilense]|eukprot:gb/GEZJ01000400.1/.p1 GENE.gb/GEZJ01000400.1/~~gb/GEZJ01000400.1/.p1  ORF type:complete len:992 (+),score=134.95 gb/GEZJ01000400.1/:401-3376(+)